MNEGYIEELENFTSESDDFLTVRNRQDIDNIYPEANIKVERDQYSIFELNRKYQKNQLILDPEFQREAVWKKEQQSELIETVLMGIPLPVFYLNETKEGKLVVVDGKQRLTTFFAFFNNDFKLKNLKILRQCNDLKFKDLEEKLQANLEDFQIIAQVIKPPTPDRIMFDIFDRVNRGGTSLNNQEMRNALYQGKSTELIQALINSEKFKKVTCNSINSTRMKDRYLVLRFISFYLLNEGLLVDDNNNFIDYKNDIDEFLGKSMEFLNKRNDEEINSIKRNFEKTMQNNLLIFKDNAFRRLPSGERKNPINMILFDAFGYLFTQFDTSFCELNKVKIKKMCYELLANNHLNKLLTDDRGRSIVITEIFKMFDGLKVRINNDI
ncbi:hypothetical protein OPHB3_3087 [Oceanobacillus picturae]|uniref:GmrSD restriction endonucleases N-terminal domain-containing protein n=1 Tax=Oceanobacillus picturae TaxID=171693 RepID=A0A0U9HFT6_9BACI|nr:DUF262 domain-containing protein [Oceanobacillus picturae]GAQ19128.1 hypothetical protein OPHB3_3087 [Oceanobacillus picturae]